MAISVTAFGGGGSGDWRKDGSNHFAFTSDSTNYMKLMSGYAYYANGASYQITSRSVYNLNTRISDSTTNCAQMFNYFQNMNSEVVIGNNVINCYKMFSECHRFNAPVTFSDSIEDMSNMFNDCDLFNQPVTIGRNAINCVNMFKECKNMNSPVYLGDNVFDTYQMFANCQWMNNTIRIGANVQNFNRMFNNCIGLDPNNVIIDSEYITCGANTIVNAANNYARYTGHVHELFWLGGEYAPTNCIINWDNLIKGNEYNNTTFYKSDPNATIWSKGNKFHTVTPSYLTSDGYFLLNNANYVANVYNNYHVNMFNYGPIRVGDNVKNCVGMFYNYFNYNQPTYFGNNVTNCYNAFGYCYKLNSHVDIPKKLEDASGMFFECNNFNQPIQFPDTLTNGYYTFGWCEKFNSPVSLGNNLVNGSRMFYTCKIFNQGVELPETLDNCREMFYNTYISHDFVIPNNVTNCHSMFSNCKFIGGNIYIKNDNLDYSIFTGLVRNANSYQKNVFCNNISVINTANAESIVGASIAWVPMLNGYYNTAFNVYIYNNMPDNI